jgi:hypothetical protein
MTSLESETHSRKLITPNEPGASWSVNKRRQNPVRLLANGVLGLTWSLLRKFCLLVFSMRVALLAIFLKLQFPLHRLFVLSGIVITAVAVRALQFD